MSPPPEDKNKMVTISVSDIEALQRLAVVESSHKILVEDFQKSRDHIDETLIKIFDKVNSIPNTVTSTVSDCKDTLEKDIKDSYMSKSAGQLMEQRFNSSVRSIKLWIVSTVTGATGTGVAILWFFKLLDGS